jgi:hypothetical protein
MRRSDRGVGVTEARLYNLQNGADAPNVKYRRDPPECCDPPER